MEVQAFVVLWRSVIASSVQILLDRLKNDVTRLPAVKAFAKIAQSPLDLALAAYVQPLVLELIAFLRKANRLLRQASLATLNVRPLLESAFIYVQLSIRLPIDVNSSK